MMKLGRRCIVHCTKILAEFEFGVHSPPGAQPPNVVFGYDVGIISAGCLVSILFFFCMLYIVTFTMDIA